MGHIKLGEILVKQGLITQKQLEEAIEVQRKDKGRIGETLIKLRMITEENMIAALGTQVGVPYYSSQNSELLRPRLDQNLDQLVSSDFDLTAVLIIHYFGRNSKE